MPVVEKNMSATIVSCPRCLGHVMSTIDLFSDTEEQASIEEYRANGFIIKNVTVADFHTIWKVCACPPNAKVAEDPYRPKKPKLSLKSKHQ